MTSTFVYIVINRSVGFIAGVYASLDRAEQVAKANPGCVVSHEPLIGA